MVINKLSLQTRSAMAGALLLLVGGCANIQNAYDTLTGVTVSPTAVYVAVNAFDAVEASATNYLRLPRCKTTGPAVVCRSPAATAAIIPAVRSGRVARNNLRQFLKDHPGQLGPKGLYDALTGTTATLQSVLGTYKAGN